MIDIMSLTEELSAAGLPVVGVSSDGRIDYSRELTPAEQQTAQAIIAAHDPAKRERDERTARETGEGGSCRPADVSRTDQPDGSAEEQGD